MVPDADASVDSRAAPVDPHAARGRGEQVYYRVPPWRLVLLVQASLLALLCARTLLGAPVWDAMVEYVSLQCFAAPIGVALVVITSSTWALRLLETTFRTRLPRFGRVPYELVERVVQTGSEVHVSLTSGEQFVLHLRDAGQATIALRERLSRGGYRDE